MKQLARRAALELLGLVATLAAAIAAAGAFVAEACAWLARKV